MEVWGEGGVPGWIYSFLPLEFLFVRLFVNRIVKLILNYIIFFNKIKSMSVILVGVLDECDLLTSKTPTMPKA